MNGRRARDEANAWIGSALVHGAAVMVVVLSHFLQPTPLNFETIEITMVSPPADVPEPPAREEELIVETPDPEPPQPEPTVEPEPIPDPPDEAPPEPDPEQEEVDEVEEEPPPEPPAAPPEPDPEAPVEDEAASEDINVVMEGLRRDFPAYYSNIIRQISRCRRWNGTGRFEATIYFVIQRDGSVSDIELTARSGNFGFDRDVFAAVDQCASKNFGPLPEEMVAERLPVALTIIPAGWPEVDGAAPSSDLRRQQR